MRIIFHSLSWREVASAQCTGDQLCMKRKQQVSLSLLSLCIFLLCPAVQRDMRFSKRSEDFKRGTDFDRRLDSKVSEVKSSH